MLVEPAGGIDVADVDVDEEEDDLDIKPADAGVLFRAEMWATNALLGYWPYLVGALVVVLLSFLFYGQYTAYITRAQRNASAEVYAQVAKLPAPVLLLGPQKAYGAMPMTDAELVSRADKIAEAARGGDGPAMVDGLLQAAEVYRLASAPERQREVLEEAAGEATRGSMPWYAAHSRIVTLDLESGDTDAAAKRLDTLRKEGRGYLAEEAALQLADVYEKQDRVEDALQVYEEFLRTWGDSPRAEEVRTRRDRVSG